MTRSRAAARLRVLAALIAALCALGALSFVPRGGARPRRGALLNAPDASRVVSFTLTPGGGGKSLRVFRSGAFWAGEADGAVFPVRGDYAEAFIAAVRAPRALTPLSGGSAALEAYSLTDAAAFRAEFRFDDGRAAGVLFGCADYTGRFTAARAAERGDAWYAADAGGLSAALTASPAAWIDGKLAPECAVPDAERVQSVTAVFPPAAPRRLERAGYAALLALRSSSLIAPEEAERRRAGGDAIVRLECGNGGAVTLRVFPLSGAGDGGEYACAPSFEGGPAGLSALRYALAISAWTYRRLAEAG